MSAVESGGAIADSIAAMGTTLGPDVLDACKALFDRDQRALAAVVPPRAIDIAYGPHPRQRLDIYAPAANQGGLPVIVFVHGGGFLKGDKGGGEVGGGGEAGDHNAWPNANVGRMAAQQGFVGVVINYRLAPEHMWPAGGDDVGAAVSWLRANIAGFGGDPGRIVLMGTSAGAVHVSTFVQRHADAAAVVRGAVLLSGLYGYTPLDDRDGFYYGAHALYPERMPRDALAATRLPLLTACAEHDPPRFQAEFLGLAADRLQRHGQMPRCHVASGHSHYSMAMHLGSSDTRLSQEIAQFVRHCCT